LEDPGVDERILLKFLSIESGDVDLIILAQSREQCPALGNTILLLWLPVKARTFFRIALVW
jgi:hypothetical protein